MNWTRKLKAVIERHDFLLPTDCQFEIVCNVAEPRNKWVRMSIFEDKYEVELLMPEVDFRAIMDKMRDIASDMDKIN